MNVYNEAHNLATAIKESDECKGFLAAKAKIEANTELSKIVNDLQARQIQLQMAQMTGNPDPDMQSKMMEISQMMMRDPTILEYFQTQMRLSLMMQDVLKIVNDAAGFDFNMPEL